MRPHRQNRQRAADGACLGRAIMRQAFKGRGGTRERNRHAEAASAAQPMLVHTTDADANGASSWVGSMQSVTQENELEAFLTMAQLAERTFSTERASLQLVQLSMGGAEPARTRPEEPTDEAEAAAANARAGCFGTGAALLRVPRRPSWKTAASPAEQRSRELEAFLQWRRALADVEERRGLLLTPFERNIEVWRQLWRVLERSDVVVQIVDARNPLLYRCPDLEEYAKEVVGDPDCSLLILNKADLLTAAQRQAWADYMRDVLKVRFVFFSANALSFTPAQEKEEEQEKMDSEFEIFTKRRSANIPVNTPNVLSTGELIRLLEIECKHAKQRKQNSTEQAVCAGTVGLIGYPNVGKSSTINAMLGYINRLSQMAAAVDASKEGNLCEEDGDSNANGVLQCVKALLRVSVSSTPGKTKHFQTIHLLPNVTLCDCPGLVFPSFAGTRAEMVCAGVLPIDQLREYTGPASLVAARIPQAGLERRYGITIKIRDDETDERRQLRTVPTGSELCSAYAMARGYWRSYHGDADEARAACYILKDYVTGKLIYVHPPPGHPGSGSEFNQEHHVALMQGDQEVVKPSKSKKPEQPKKIQELSEHDSSETPPVVITSDRGLELDRAFFGAREAGVAYANALNPYQTTSETKEKGMLPPSKKHKGRKGGALQRASRTTL